LIKNPDKRKEEDILKKQNLDSINFLCYVNDEYKEEKRKNIELYGSDYYDSDESDYNSEEDSDDGTKVDGVNLIKLKKWIKNKNTIFGKILRFLYSQNKQFIVEDIMNAIDYDGSPEQFLNNIKNGSGKKSQFGLLWNYSRNNVVINPNIYEIIKNM
jgi:hypothetical protein